MENTKIYAISKFAKDLIEIPDNLGMLGSYWTPYFRKSYRCF